MAEGSWSSAFILSLYVRQANKGCYRMIRYFCIWVSYFLFLSSSMAQTVSDVTRRSVAGSFEFVLSGDVSLKPEVYYYGDADRPSVIILLKGVSWEPAPKQIYQDGDVLSYAWFDNVIIIKLRRPLSVAVREPEHEDGDTQYQTILTLSEISIDHFDRLVEDNAITVGSLKLPNLQDITESVPQPVIKPEQSNPVPDEKEVETDTSVTKTGIAEGEKRGATEQNRGLVPQFLKQENKDLRKVIVIDPGHGGKDPGTTQHDTIEKDVVLDVALKMEKILEKNQGYVVYLTRQDDQFIGLEDRLTFARDRNADVFISLHADAAESPVASGASVFILSAQGVERSEDVLNTNNWDLHDQLAVDKPSNDVLDDLWKRAVRANTSILAQKIIEEFTEVIPMVDYPLRNASYYVLLDLKAPAVLVELGYITNILDARRLSAPESRTEAADAITRAIDGYFAYYDQSLARE